LKLQAKHRTLDKWFSLYVRMRDASEFNNFGRCCSCGRVISFEESDCGHFISRDRIATRWDERNAHAQCRNCNRFRSGEQHAHGQHILKLYGQQVLHELIWKSKHPKNFTDQEIKDLTDFYRTKYKAML